MQGITVTKGFYESLGGNYDFKPTGILTADKTTDNYEGISGIMSIADIVEGWEEIAGQMSVFVNIMGRCRYSFGCRAV